MGVCDIIEKDDSEHGVIVSEYLNVRVAILGDLQCVFCVALHHVAVQRRASKQC